AGVRPSLGRRGAAARSGRPPARRVLCRPRLCPPNRHRRVHRTLARVLANVDGGGRASAIGRVEGREGTGMKPCISEATTLPCAFAEDVAAYADAGCGGVEVWLTKLENHLETHSLADTQKLLADRRMTLAAAAYQGGLLLSQGEQRRAHFDH